LTNPKFYDKDFFHGTIKKTALEIWDKDEYKIKIMKKRGFDVLVIWEDDFVNNRKKVIEQCNWFLNE